MLLQPGGMDIFYIDESNDRSLYAVSAVAVPFLRNIDGVWQITWPAHLSAAKEWRGRLSRELKIPTTKELHGTKLAGGRGNYVYGKRQIPTSEIPSYYRKILGDIDFLPPESVITVTGTRGREMYGHARLERVMYALFQRMRRQCQSRNVNAMVFFDEGHPEYRTLYRRAMKHLPTGSMFGEQRDLPLDMFVKDGNSKNSKLCHFTQLADLIAYAAFLKVRAEMGHLEPHRVAAGLGTLFDALPVGVRNMKAAGQADDGIVRLG
jgi:hypothetical protein